MHHNHQKKESDFCARDYIGKEDEEEFTAVFRGKCPVALHATFDVPVRQLMERFHYLESIDVEPDSTRLAIDSVLRMHNYPTSDKVEEDIWENNFEKLLEEMESRNEIKKIKRYDRPYGMPSL